MDKTKVFFDIYWQNDKEAKGDLIIDTSENDNEFHGKIYPAISGPWGNGHLEKGDYLIVSSINLDDITKNNPYKKDGFPWMAGLKPLFETERNNLAIHPDGNVRGSLGCIAITERDLYAYVDIYTLMRRYKQVKMKVV